MAQVVPQSEDPYNFALPSTFQQFLYEKFKQEFSTQGTRQSFYSKGASEYSALHDFAVPQRQHHLGLSTRDRFEHTTTFDTSPSGPMTKLRSHRTDSKDLEEYDSGQSQEKPNLPQQLIVSKSTTLAPIRAEKKKTRAVRGRETRKSESSGPRGQEDKLHKGTKERPRVGAVDVNLRTMPHKAEVETTPRVSAKKTKHHKADLVTSPRAVVKSKGAEGKRLAKRMQSSSTVEMIKLPRLVKGRGGEARKETKSEAREPKDKPKYKPYSLKDYIRLKKTPTKLGGLGPASVGTEQWHREMKKRYRMAEYMKKLKSEGDQTRSTDAIESHRTS
jgi:hypothetical protein